MKQTQPFDLNIVPRGAPPVVHVCQYDTGARAFTATLYDDTGTLDLTGVTAVEISGVKPDGTGFIAGSATISPLASTITWDCTAQMTAVAGTFKCGIALFDANNKRLGTLCFVLDVQPAAVPVEAITSASDFGTMVSDAVNAWLDTNGHITRVSHYITAPNGTPWGDANGDGVVDNRDLALASAQLTQPSSNFNTPAMLFYEQENDNVYSNADHIIFERLYREGILTGKKIMKTVLRFSAGEDNTWEKTVWGLTD